MLTAGEGTGVSGKGWADYTGGLVCQEMGSEGWAVECIDSV